MNHASVNKPAPLSFLEWNLNARSGGPKYSIPSFVIDKIQNEKADIIVLVEFSAPEAAWSKFCEQLPAYALFCSPFQGGYNQVCIGVKKTLDYTAQPISRNDTNDIKDPKVPEYLQVDLKQDESTLLSIIGVRIKTQGNQKPAQYRWLKEMLSRKARFLCLGDFNCTSSELQGKIDPQTNAVVYGPRIKNGYHSYVFPDGSTQGLDWAILKGGTANNPYPDQAKSPYATYSWDFVTKANGYGDKTSQNYLDVLGKPDHAMLKGKFRFE